MFARSRDYFYQRQRAWLDQRIPQAERYQLNNKSIFILPTRFGWLFIIVAVLIFMIASNYQHLGLVGVAYFMLALFVVHLFASYLNFSRLHVSIGQIKPVFAGTTAAVPLTLITPRHQRRAKGTLWVNFMPSDISATKRFQAIELDNLESQYNIRYFAQQRGVYPLPRMTLQCDYPLGLFRCWTHLQFTQRITVYPSPQKGQVPLEHIPQLDEPLDSEGISGVENAQHDEFAELGKYQLGDPLHAVAWKQRAKTGKMLKKHFTGFSRRQGYLSLPITDNIELALSQITYQINQSHDAHDIYGLFLPHVQIQPANSEAHRLACLQALAEFPQTAATVSR